MMFDLPHIERIDDEIDVSQGQFSLLIMASSQHGWGDVKLHLAID